MASAGRCRSTIGRTTTSMKSRPPGSMRGGGNSDCRRVRMSRRRRDGAADLRADLSRMAGDLAMEASMNLHLVLYVAAFVLFTLAAFGVPTVPPRFNLIAGGLALLALTLFL